MRVASWIRRLPPKEDIAGSNSASNIFSKSRTIHHTSSVCQLGKSWLFVRRLSSTTHRAVLPSGAWVAVPSVWPCPKTKPGPKQNQSLRLIWIGRAPKNRPSSIRGEQRNMRLGFPAFGFLGFFLGFRFWVSFFVAFLPPPFPRTVLHQPHRTAFRDSGPYIKFARRLQHCCFRSGCDEHA